MRIIDYKIVHEDFVLDLIKESWQPFNAPFAAKEEGKEIYIQAMVKYIAPKPPLGCSNDLHKENAKLKQEIEDLKHKLDDSSILIESLQKELEHSKTDFQLLSTDYKSLIKVYGIKKDQLQKQNSLLNERSQPRDDALLTAINENEILKQIAVDLIHAYSRHDEDEGYFVIIEGNDYYSKSFYFQGEQILKKIIEHRKRLNENNK